MKTIGQILILLLFSIPALVFASPRAELYLWKKYSHFQGACGHCAQLARFDEKENPPNFASYDSLSTMAGSYYLDLAGPKGTTVTLFGSANHDSGRGFLIVAKKDESPISITELERFSEDRWQDVEAREGVTGAYSAYYHSYENFKNNVASVKWGEWWPELPGAAAGAK